MTFELTDDLFYIVTHTYKGDVKLRDFQHFCAPGKAKECVSHTVLEILEETVGEVEFYAIMDEGLKGFVCYDMDGSRLFNFGLHITYRQNDVKVLKEMINFKSVKTIRIWECNDRDMKTASSLGCEEVSRELRSSSITYKTA